MKQLKLPKRIDYQHLIHSAGSIDGELAIEVLDRLKGLLQKSEGTVKLTLEYYKDNQGLIIIKGTIKTLLVLQCQRCLADFDYALTTHFLLSPVSTDEQAKALPSNIEPVLLENDSINLYSLLEDDILLNIPLITRHELADENCKMLKQQKNQKKDFKIDNPFSKLAVLKKKH